TRVVWVCTPRHGVRGEPLLPVLVVANSSRIRCRYQRLRACRRVECRVNFSSVVQHDPAIVVALAQDRKECGEIHTPRAETLVEIHSVVLLPARSQALSSHWRCCTWPRSP